MQYAAPLLLIRCVGLKALYSGANEWYEIANINHFLPHTASAED
jgi:hypothetical protein